MDCEPGRPSQLLSKGRHQAANQVNSRSLWCPYSKTPLSCEYHHLKYEPGRTGFEPATLVLTDLGALSSSAVPSQQLFLDCVAALYTFALSQDATVQDPLTRIRGVCYARPSLASLQRSI